jgi:alpha-L-fucosidase
MKKISLPLSLLFICSVPMTTSAEVLYPDESRAAIGKDAQSAIKRLDPTTYKRPHYRVPDNAYHADWEKLRDQPVPKWLEDGKFGIYTHWGLYSIPGNSQASNTYIRYMYKDGVDESKMDFKVSEFHRERYGEPAEFGYSDFTDLFKCEGFDGQEYVDVMLDAGAKFGGLCIVHHDGFLLWDSDVVPWNVGKMGPERDIYGEFDSGLKTIATFHHARSFGYATAKLTEDDFTAAQKAKLDLFNPKFDTWFFPQWGSADEELFDELWRKKVREVVDKYQPDSLWFDGLKPAAHCTEASQLDVFNHYYDSARQSGQEVAIFNKLPGTGVFNFPQGVGIKCYEGGRDQPPFATGPFLVDKAISYPWSYVENKQYKFGPDYHVDALIDMTARGGYYFMSLTPMGDGSIPQREKEICAEIGKWLRINGEAIYGTRMWEIATEGPLGTFMHKPEKRVVYWDYRAREKAGQIRFTQKDGWLYPIFLDWSDDSFMIRSLGKDMLPNAKLKSVELLGYDGELVVEQNAEALVIQSPEKAPHDYAYAFKIKLSGEVGDRMVAAPASRMEEEGLSYSHIYAKHKDMNHSPK